MKALYIALIYVEILIILVCMAKVRKYKTEIAGVLFKLLFVALIAVASNSIYKITGHETVGLLFHGLFFAMIDWTLITMVEFVECYTKTFRAKSIIKKLCYGFAICDSISMLINVFTKHVFTIYRETYDAGYSFFAVKEFFLPYHIHLAFSYVLVAFIAAPLIHRTIVSSSFYRKKYSIILFLFCIIIAFDGIFLKLDLPFDFSFLLYGFLAIAIFYFAIIYIPNGLVANTLALMVKDMDMAFICLDVNFKIVYRNDAAIRYMEQDDDISKLEAQFATFVANNEFDEDGCYKWTEQRQEKDGLHYYNGEWKKYLDDRGQFIGSHIRITDTTQQVEHYQREIVLAEEANQAKSNFLMNMSHEIRTPINSVFGMTEMILRESKDSEIRKYAMDIKTSSQTLISIINDVLDFSKIESGKMELMQVEYELAKLLNNLVNIMIGRAQEKNLKFDVIVEPTLPSVLIGDDVRLQQILLNLLSNAIKYTHEGSVVMKVDGYTTGDVAVMTFTVSDTGIGMKEEDIPRLFEAFERLEESRNRNIQGTGLGMHITSNLLHLMDSELKVESVYGEGSTFYFELKQKIVSGVPIGDYREVMRKKASDYVYEASFTAEGKKILVVDDNRVNRKVFAGLLKKTKLQISDVGSGKECLALIQKEHFDLIFLDHLMPEMDGLETLEHMKQTEHLCMDTPVIMLTANALAGAKEQYLATGFDDFLAKPIDPERLEAIIRKHIFPSSTSEIFVNAES